MKDISKLLKSNLLCDNCLLFPKLQIYMRDFSVFTHPCRRETGWNTFGLAPRRNCWSLMKKQTNTTTANQSRKWIRTCQRKRAVDERRSWRWKGWGVDDWAGASSPGAVMVHAAYAPLADAAVVRSGRSVGFTATAHRPALAALNPWKTGSRSQPLLCETVGVGPNKLIWGQNLGRI